jgi:hypothetical protein
MESRYKFLLIFVLLVSFAGEFAVDARIAGRLAAIELKQSETLDLVRHATFIPCGVVCGGPQVPAVDKRIAKIEKQQDDDAIVLLAIEKAIRNVTEAERSNTLSIRMHNLMFAALAGIEAKP